MPVIDTATLYFYVRALGIKKNADKLRETHPNGPLDFMQIDFAGIDALAKRINSELRKDRLLHIVRLAVAGPEEEWVHP